MANGRLWKNSSLSLVMFGLFALTFVGHAVAGWKQFNEEQATHGARELAFRSYLGTGQFLESVFENWESEFLQMAAFLVFSAFLIQRGSAESKKPKDELTNGEPEEFDKDPRAARRPDSPGPVHRGGLVLKLYSNSLSLTLFALFVLSFILHGVTGAKFFNEEQLQHGQHAISTLAYFGKAQFWFESLQNWQSEFLSIGVLVVLSIWLRQKGSPESKPVHAPHRQTGDEA